MQYQFVVFPFEQGTEDAFFRNRTYIILYNTVVFYETERFWVIYHVNILLIDSFMRKNIKENATYYNI